MRLLQELSQHLTGLPLWLVLAHCQTPHPTPQSPGRFRPTVTKHQPLRSVCTGTFRTRPQDVATSRTLMGCQPIFLHKDPRRLNFRKHPQWINRWWQLGDAVRVVLCYRIWGSWETACSCSRCVLQKKQKKPAAGFALPSRCEQTVRCIISPLDEAQVQKE